jgi:predicted lipoprotein with Yx(FWY)xxD motif
MRTRGLAIAGAAFAVALGGCGEEDDADMRVSGGGSGVTERDEATPADEPAAKPRRAATIVLRGSEFGSMLFNSAKQAIYVFENDRPNETVCYGECAEAWPPVYTEGPPKAGRDVDESLLGAIERRDGRMQVTYAGKPLYFYAHESPGEVRCHNVDLNGGLWWVVGPDGEPRPA